METSPVRGLIPMLRLLMPADSDFHSPSASIEIEGVRWVVRDFAFDAAQPPPVAYTCVSYAWGAGRTPSPFETSLAVSDRALPVVAATIRALRPAAIWVDAFCMPSDEPAKTTTLRGLGALYAGAKQLAVVLSEACSPVLAKAHADGVIDAEALAILERDPWVSRVWTYQEMVNCSRVDFLAENGTGEVIAGQPFLNVVSAAISAIHRSQGSDSFALRKTHPNLDALEDLIADWMIGNYLERSAYQIMSSMDRRRSQQADDYFHAMLGALTATPPAAAEIRLSAAECFLQACEAKGDFSFIYSDAARNTAPGRRWRPLPLRLACILPWHTYGDGQPGVLTETHLELQGVCLLHRGVPAPEVLPAIRNRFMDQSFVEGADPAKPILVRLRAAGFTGCGRSIECEEGYFFPQLEPTDDGLAVFIAPGVRWAFGAAGLLAGPANNRAGADRYEFHCAGAFVGRVPAADSSVLIT